VLTIDELDPNKQKVPVVALPEQKPELQPSIPNTGVEPATKPTTTPPLVVSEEKEAKEKPSEEKSDKTDPTKKENDQKDSEKEAEKEKDKKETDHSEKKTACEKLNENDKKDEKVKTKHVWNDTNKSCEEQDLSPKEKCEKLNLETRDDVGRVLNKYKWDESKKGCIEKKKNEDGTYVDDNEKEDPRQMIDNTPKVPPARFSPVQIPMRQIYMLPGMP
jgi:hypothetical protein